MNSLVQKAKNGDPDAFVDLMRSHMQTMYKTAKSILRSDEDVADAVQETILRCWEKIGQLKENRYFKTWMTRILVNICYDLIKARQDPLPDEAAAGIAVRDVNFDNIEWNQVLGSLDERYRLVLMLYYVEGFKTGEISRILDIPEATVRTRLARGRERLSSAYQNRERSVLL